MSRAPLAKEAEADVLVLGAGLAGCAAAFEAARRGKRAIVLEADRVGSGASARDVGHVAVGLDEPYVMAVARLGREAARTLWETHREGHARLAEVLAELGDDCGHRRDGGFRVARDRPEAAALADSEDLLREDGFSGEFLDHYMLDVRFDARGFAAAYWAADDGAVETKRLVDALAFAAELRGAAIHESSPVLDLDLSARGAEAVTRRGRIRAPQAVIALDAVVRLHAPVVADRLVVLEGERLVLEADPDAAVPSPARTADGCFVWRSTAAGLLVGRLTPAAVAGADAGESTEAFARTHFPRLGAAVLHRGTVATSVSADGLPLIGSLPGLPAVVTCGYGGLAQTQVLLGARWAVEAAVTGRDPTPAPFRASRALPADVR